MTQCYIVFAYEQYEGSEPVKVFLNKDSADKFSDICNEYHQTKPIDEGFDTDAPEFEQWLREQDEWLNNHPAKKDAAYADSFIVREIELEPN